MVLQHDIATNTQPTTYDAAINERERYFSCHLGAPAWALPHDLSPGWHCITAGTPIQLAAAAAAGGGGGGGEAGEVADEATGAAGTPACIGGGGGGEGAGVGVGEGEGDRPEVMMLLMGAPVTVPVKKFGCTHSTFHHFPCTLRAVGLQARSTCRVHGVKPAAGGLPAHRGTGGSGPQLDGVLAWPCGRPSGKSLQELPACWGASTVCSIVMQSPVAFEQEADKSLSLQGAFCGCITCAVPPEHASCPPAHWPAQSDGCRASVNHAHNEHEKCVHAGVEGPANVVGSVFIMVEMAWGHDIVTPGGRSMEKVARKTLRNYSRVNKSYC